MWDHQANHFSVSSSAFFCFFFIARVAGTDVHGVALPPGCDAVLDQNGLHPCRRLRGPPVPLQGDTVHEEGNPGFQTKYPFLIVFG